MNHTSRLKRLNTITNGCSHFLLWLGAIGLLMMTAIVGYQVFGRYVLQSSPSWSEQLSLTLMIWYVAFGAAAGVREGFHIRIVALENAVPHAISKGMRIASDTIVGICGVAMLIGGFILVSKTWSHVIPSLGIPRGLAYTGLPIAGTLIALFALERVMETLGQENLVDDEEDPRWS